MSEIRIGVEQARPDMIQGGGVGSYRLDRQVGAFVHMISMPV